MTTVRYDLYSVLQTLEHAREALRDVEAPRVRALLYIDDAYEALRALTYLTDEGETR